MHSNVEALDVSNMQWSTLPSTPTPWRAMKSIVVEDIWYLMGGYCNDVGWSQYVYSTSLETLVSHSTLDGSTIWKKWPSLNCAKSCPLNIGGSLLAAGGMDMEDHKVVPAIHCYVVESNTWVQAGELPQGLRDCTCTMISDRIYVMGRRWLQRSILHLLSLVFYTVNGQFTFIWVFSC